MKVAALLTAAILLLGAAPDGTVAPPAAPVASPAPATAPAGPAAERYTVEIGAGSDHLTGDNAAWSDAYMQATQRGNGGAPSFYERAEEGNRYGLHDRQYGAGVYLKASPRTIVSVELGNSPTHNAVPSFSGGAGVEQRFAGGYGASAGFTRRTYPSTNASIETAGADRYAGRYRFAYTVSLAQLAGTPGTAVTHAVGVSRYGDRGGDVTVRAYAGRDVESTGSSVLVMKVTGASVGGHLPVASHTALAYGLETFTQGSRYSGTGIRIGVSRRF